MLTIILLLVHVLVLAPLAVTVIRAGADKRVSRGAWVFSIITSIGGFIALRVALWWSGVHVDALWFAELGQLDRFWTLFQFRWGAFFGAGFVAFVVMALGGLLSYLFLRKSKPIKEAKPAMLLVTGGMSVLAAFIFGIWARLSWNRLVLHFNASETGIADPIFGQDASFYMFNLPFWRMLLAMAFIILIFLAVQAGVYSYIGSIEKRVVRPHPRRMYSFLYESEDESSEEDEEYELIPNSERGDEALRAMTPLFFMLGAVFVGLIAVWRYLVPYGYVTSDSGLLAGATYVDVQYRIGFNNILLGVLALTAAAVLACAFVKSTKARTWLAASPAVLSVLTLVVMMGIVPSVIQRASVQADEFNLEEPFLEHNIEFTRFAYGIDDTEEHRYNPQFENVDEDALLGDAETLDNIRLADWRALASTMQQRQVLRRYYEFTDVDIDRYEIDGETRQVMLSARELNQDLLHEGAQTWVNRRLRFTHGYGVAAVGVNEFTRGLPNFLVQDIPPRSANERLALERPEIYFGELTNEMVLVNTTTDEFSHPSGEGNVTTRYEGEAGIELGSALSFRRFALAREFNELRFYTSNALKDDSRVLFRRDLESRVEELAPFLEYEYDPYIVIGEDGGLYWIWDAYTTSDRFPYSQSNGDINYIRNSVKVVVDAYDGSVDFYVFDEEDPVLNTWRNVFPDMFTPKSEMPQGLKSHIRYPEELLLTQSQVYGIYHMEDTETFYNREDAWTMARERYYGESQRVDPYYVNMRLPDQDESEFVLMAPFTPLGSEGQQRNNLVGWLAGRSDGDNYGNLVVYKMPQGRLVPGPMQIEALIDSDEQISQQLTLWDQRGSRVIRGNMLTIPIADTIMYVEPVYLEADQDPIPRLERVVVGIGETIAWGRDLEEALQNVLARIETGYAPDGAEDDLEDVVLGVAELAASASEHYERYLALMGEGRVTEAARELEQLERVLEQLREATSIEEEAQPEE